MSCSDRSTQALPILKAAWDRGVTTWDTANAYSNGESERIIAKAIKKVRFLVRTTWAVSHECISPVQYSAPPPYHSHQVLQPGPGHAGDEHA
jgi:aryl-alcohol dehydrogenase-like predicted oxidoreductase